MLTITINIFISGGGWGGVPRPDQKDDYVLYYVGLCWVYQMKSSCHPLLCFRGLFCTTQYASISTLSWGGCPNYCTLTYNLTYFSKTNIWTPTPIYCPRVHLRLLTAWVFRTVLWTKSGSSTQRERWIRGEWNRDYLISYCTSAMWFWWWSTSNNCYNVVMGLVGGGNRVSPCILVFL